MSGGPESRAERWLTEFVAAEVIEVLPDLHASFPGLEHAGTDRIARLDEVGLLRTIVACESAVARAQAVQLRALARLGQLQGDARSTAAEVALAVSSTENRAQGQLDLAETLTTRLPHTLAAMEAGTIDSYKASKVADATALLDDSTAGEADAILADRLAGKNPSGLRQAAARIAARLDPAGADRRAAERRHTRKVSLRPGGEGMATLAAELPAEQATAIYARLDRAARKLRGSGEERNLDQLRADLFTELCLGTGPTAVKPPAAEWLFLNWFPGGQPTPRRALAKPRDSGGGAPVQGLDSHTLARPGDGTAIARSSGTSTEASAAEPPAEGAARSSTSDEHGTATPPITTGQVRTEVFVYLSAATLIGASDEPGELAGHGSLPAAIARAIAHDPNATWRRVLTDPVDGQILDVGRTRYRPPADLDDLVRIRDRTCRHPGCHRPSHHGDLDHHEPWSSQSGATSAVNLLGFCRKHHRLKDYPGWTHQLDHDTGTVTVTTPAEQNYTSVPEDPPF